MAVLNMAAVRKRISKTAQKRESSGAEMRNEMKKIGKNQIYLKCKINIEYLSSEPRPYTHETRLFVSCHFFELS